jgi:hypothetical protein
MKREYPATPDEAFEQALEGAYFAHDLYAAQKQGRIGGFPYDPRHPVQSFWDLGRNDLNTIWASGRKVQQKFSVSVHGEEVARELAIETRHWATQAYRKRLAQLLRSDRTK